MHAYRDHIATLPIAAVGGGGGGGMGPRVNSAPKMNNSIGRNNRRPSWNKDMGTFIILPILTYWFT